jgi:hypothetical protein
MRFELQPLPKAVTGKADQNKPADDHLTLQHREPRLGSNHEGGTNDLLGRCTIKAKPPMAAQPNMAGSLNY